MPQRFSFFLFFVVTTAITGAFVLVSSTIYDQLFMTNLAFVDDYDLYRAECPARVRKPEFTNEIKGTKRYKKKVEKISRFERKRSKYNNISNVFFLLDQLEAQKCVK